MEHTCATCALNTARPQCWLAWCELRLDFMAKDKPACKDWREPEKEQGDGRD